MTLGQPGALPEKSGLYDPANEQDSCGVGFICDIKGRPSHKIVADAAHMNCCMEHRGGVGYEKNTGDGAGILTGMPRRLFNEIAEQEMGINLPEAGKYGAGNVFLPVDEDERAHCKTVFEEEIRAAGQTLLGWRVLPVDPDYADVGRAARAEMPHFEQLFIGAAEGLQGDDFERKLYIIRKRATHRLRSDTNLTHRKQLYVCSLSSKVIVYKGMLTPEQLFMFYQDLRNEAYESHLAMVHSRFSTNTFPSMGSGAAEPLHEPQRRNQHPAGQSQFHERPPGHRGVRVVRRRSAATVPDCGEGLLRFPAASTMCWNFCSCPAASCRKQC